MAITEIEPEELKARRRAGEDIFLLDVREPDEVAEWAFPGSVNIPLGQLGARTGELPTDRPIVVACRSGARSASATEALSRGGWSAQNLAGGAIAWVSTEEAGPGSS
ncbi:MAG TPA: rhodanese-like domain-containing protein [Acidimicrobiales bacterium]|nr:rhodanese-like domain-containing protein [Acidimicrobiales bacterium]